MGLLKRFRAAISAFCSGDSGNIDDTSASDVVRATVFGRKRRVRLIAPYGFYHVHAESIGDDDGPQGLYLIDTNAVDSRDAEKFRRFVEAKRVE